MSNCSKTSTVQELMPRIVIFVTVRQILDFTCVVFLSVFLQSGFKYEFNMHQGANLIVYSSQGQTKIDDIIHKVPHSLCFIRVTLNNLPAIVCILSQLKSSMCAGSLLTHVNTHTHTHTHALVIPWGKLANRTCWNIRLSVPRTTFSWAVTSRQANWTFPDFLSEHTVPAGFNCNANT